MSKQYFVEVFFTNINQSELRIIVKLQIIAELQIIVELWIIVELRTLRILDLKIRKCLQYLNLQLICNSELQVPSLAITNFIVFTKKDKKIRIIVYMRNIGWTNINRVIHPFRDLFYKFNHHDKYVQYYNIQFKGSFFKVA